VVLGRRDGGWLALTREPGYIALQRDGESCLRQRTVRYEELSGGGTCADAGLFPIPDAGVCEAAALALGYFSTAAKPYRGDGPRPEGCHLRRGELWLTAPGSEGDPGAAEGLRPICSTQPYPRTAATATVTSTATATTTATATSSTTTATTTTAATSTTSTSWGSPSLLCFSVMRTDGYELGLVKAQVRKGAGIFQCDEHAVFSEVGGLQLGTLPGGQAVESLHFEKAAVGVSQDHTAANTLLFMHLWDAVKRDGRFGRHDWTVKADPDAVVLPRRLRKHLAAHSGHKNYLVNCNKYPGTANFPMIYGALEAYSGPALQAYFQGEERCRSELRWQAWGEDFFMGRCMKLLGVEEFDDFTLLGDKRCMGADCQDKVSGAYHDFKSIESWFDCWGQATL